MQIFFLNEIFFPRQISLNNHTFCNGKAMFNRLIVIQAITFKSMPDSMPEVQCFSDMLFFKILNNYLIFYFKRTINQLFDIHFADVTQIRYLMPKIINRNQSMLEHCLTATQPFI